MVKYMESTAQKAKLKSFSPAYFTPVFTFNWGGGGGAELRRPPVYTICIKIRIH